uniref:Uncharacterized protein n=1 Tax=Tanacetum cinerariifolium TaxID=118510 RepID=A0A699JX57_TANCI|nr:hypothetical protein [Tanacetum cinerariifolium]
MHETQQAVVQNSISSAQQDAQMLSMIEQLKTQNAEIDPLKQTFSGQLKEKESLMKTITVLKGVKLSTSASGSQPSGNTKKDKIQRPPSSTHKNKVEAYYRTVKSSLENKNYVVEPKGTANVQHSMLNANSELICVKCNG